MRDDIPQADARSTRPQEPIAELLAALDELYPLDEDDQRVERAGRTSFVLKRWLQREQAELERLALESLRVARSTREPQEKL